MDWASSSLSMLIWWADSVPAERENLDKERQRRTDRSETETDLAMSFEVNRFKYLGETTWEWMLRKHLQHPFRSLTAFHSKEMNGKFMIFFIRELGKIQMELRPGGKKVRASISVWVAAKHRCLPSIFIRACSRFISGSCLTRFISCHAASWRHL